MPVTKQAVKRVKQAEKAAVRNRHYKNQMKSITKTLLACIKNNEKEKAEKLLPEAVSVIATCAKKFIIHKNNASRKKSQIQKAVNNLSRAKVEKESEKPKKEKKK